MDYFKENERPWFIFGHSSKKEDATSEDVDNSKDTYISEQGRSSANETQTKSRNENLSTDPTSMKTRETETSASPKKLLGFIFVLVVFMVICSLVFPLLERTKEHEQMKFWTTVKQDLANQFNLSDKELLQLVVRLDGIKKYGLSTKTRWNFYNSFWFTMTITTTIGFGHITPITTAGRLFCIICGLFGIPLNALVLKHVGDKIRIWTTNGIRTFETRCLGRSKCKDAGVKCACVTFLIMVTFILIGSCLDLMFDGWTFTDGAYFNFIALSTVGFGDIYPSVSNPSKLDDLGLGMTEKRFLASGIMMVYLTFGLAIVSSVVVSIVTAMDEVEKAKKKIVKWRKHGKMQSGMDDDDLGRNSEMSHEVFGNFIEASSFEERYGKIGKTRF